MSNILDLRQKPIEVGDKMIYLPNGPMELTVKDIKEVIVARGPDQGRKLICEVTLPVPNGPCIAGNTFIVEKKAKESGLISE